MEVHLLAKLDLDGRIQSVQSRCASTGDGPITPTLPDRPERHSTGTVDSNTERFVPYMEKKQLACSLGAKVDEMSIMIRELADLTERNKLQNKLIKQYESTMESMKRKIHKLEIENFRLKSHAKLNDGNRLLNMSLDRSITSLKRLAHTPIKDERFKMPMRSMSWPEGICDSTRFNGLTLSPDAINIHTVNTIDEFQTASDSEDEVAVPSIPPKALRPNSLKFDLDISSSHSRLNVDFESSFVFPKMCRHKREYSYVENPEKQNAKENEQVVKEIPIPAVRGNTKTSPKRSPKPSPERSPPHCIRDPYTGLLVGSTGYLDMNQFNLPASEIFEFSNSPDGNSVDTVDGPMDEIHVDHGEVKRHSGNRHHADEIHGTIRDVQKGYISSLELASHVDVNNYTKERLKHDRAERRKRPESCEGSPRYEMIQHIDETLPSEDKPPTPPPRYYSRSDSKTSQWSSHSNDSEKRVTFALTPTKQSAADITVQRNSHSEDERQTEHRSNKHSPTVEERRPDRRHLEHRHTEHDLMSLKRNSTDEDMTQSQCNRLRAHSSPCITPLTPFGTDRSLGSSLPTSSSNTGDARKDDTCALNQLLKDMRTTMEWNEAKRRVMNQSHMNTVEHTEKQLRRVVEDVFKTYGTVKPKNRSRQRFKEKVVEKTKTLLEKQRAATLVSDEFLIKCVDMTIMTTPVQPTGRHSGGI